MKSLSLVPAALLLLAGSAAAATPPHLSSSEAPLVVTIAPAGGSDYGGVAPADPGPLILLAWLSPDRSDVLTSRGEIVLSGGGQAGNRDLDLGHLLGPVIDATYRSDPPANLLAGFGDSGGGPAFAPPADAGDDHVSAAADLVLARR